MTNRWETMETLADFIFLGSKITADGEIKIPLLLGRKVMIKLYSVLKSRLITFLTKIHLVKAMVFPVVIYGCDSWTIKKRLSAEELMFLNCGAGQDSWESLGQQGNQNSKPYGKSIWNIHCKDWCWSWSSNTLATWCEELTHWKRSWCRERLRRRR